MIPLHYQRVLTRSRVHSDGVATSIYKCRNENRPLCATLQSVSRLELEQPQPPFRPVRTTAGTARRHRLLSKRAGYRSHCTSQNIEEKAHDFSRVEDVNLGFGPILRIDSCSSQNRRLLQTQIRIQEFIAYSRHASQSLVELSSEKCAGWDLNPGCDHGKVT